MTNLEILEFEFVFYGFRANILLLQHGKCQAPRFESIQIIEFTMSCR